MNRLISMSRLLLFFILISGVSYSQITLTLPTVSGATGKDITNAPVTISDLTGKGVSSFAFQINYNPSIIKIYGNSTSGTMLDGSSITSFADTVNGIYRLVWASSQNLTGSGTLMNLKIKIKSQGSSAISYNSLLTYADGSSAPSQFGDGSNAVTAVNGTATSTGANTAPTLNLNPTAPYSVQEGQALNIQLNGTDPNVGDVITYSYSSIPTMTGATVNPTTGAFSWTPVTNQAGIYNVTFTATDGKSPTSIPTTITVVKTNIAPTLSVSPTGPYSLMEGATLAITLTGADANAGDVLTYTVTSNPTLAGGSLNSTTHIYTVTGTASNVGKYDLTFTVSDGTTSKQIVATLTITPLNAAPTLTLTPNGPYTTPEGQALNIQLTGTDSDVGDVVTYSYTSTPTMTGASLNPTTGAFSWTPATNQAGVYNVTFTATDSKTPKNVNTTITVTKVNIAPTLSLSPVGPYSIIEGSSLSVTLTGADVNNGDVLTYTVTSNPTLSGATLNSSTHVFSVIASAANVGDYDLTFTVSDGTLTKEIKYTLKISLLNSAPTLTLNPSGPYAVDEGSTLTFSAVGADDNPGDVLVYSYTSTPAINDASFNTSNGSFSWKPATNQAGIYNLTFSVTDGKVATPTQVKTTITVNKVNLAPTLTLDPAGPYLVYEGQTIKITLVGTDPNSGDVLTYLITAPTTLPEGVKLTDNIFSWTPNLSQGTTTPYNFSFRVKDQSGLTSSIVSIMIVVGNTNQPPVFTTKLPAGKIAVTNTPAPIVFTFKYVATDPDGDKLFFSLLGGPVGASITADGEFSWAPTVDQANKSFTVKVEVSDGTATAQAIEVISAGPVVGVETESGLPKEFSMKQNYPNPFNPTTRIDYSLPKESQVRISVYDVLGKEIVELVNGYVNAGFHSVNFDASKFTSGLYIYRIQADGYSSIRKMLLMK